MTQRLMLDLVASSAESGLGLGQTSYGLRPLVRSLLKGVLPTFRDLAAGRIPELSPKDNITRMASNAPLPRVSGRVEATNKTGIRLDNGNWYNYSDYGYRGPKDPRAGQPEPQVGQYVTAEIKNDKFLQTLVIGGNGQVTTPDFNPAPQTAAPALAPAPVAPQPTTRQDDLIRLQIETRLTILKTMSVARPQVFTLETLEELVETVRGLEAFVLEEMLTRTSTVEDDDVILDEDSELDETV